jgi:hypothetical protein
MKEVLDSKQKLINDCGNGVVVLFYDEKEVTETERVQTSEDSFEDKEVTRYAYNMLELENVIQPVNEQNVIYALRQLVLDNISAYDKSSVVNSFTINGNAVWFDRETRAVLMRRFEAEKATGATETTLWYGIKNITIPIDKAIEMSNEVEVYACKCLDTTTAHKAAVSELTDINELLAYDYTTGYPDKLSFSI